MTEVETHAIARVNAQPPESGDPICYLHGLVYRALVAAEQELIDERKAYAAFRQEVSDTMGNILRNIEGNSPHLSGLLHIICARYVIPEPNPLDEKLDKLASDLGMNRDELLGFAESCGLKITENPDG